MKTTIILFVMAFSLMSCKKTETEIQPLNTPHVAPPSINTPKVERL